MVTDNSTVSTHKNSLKSNRASFSWYFHDYKHNPLPGPQWIRVLIINPEPSKKATITCSIKNWSIESNSYERSGPSVVDNLDGYEALSWCWGDESSQTEIGIEENGTTYAFTVRCSLNEALRSLRHAERPRALWIDAVCINQEDLTERNQQVANMGRIYGNAQNVCIWLGRSSPQIQAAIWFIQNHAFRVYAFDELCKNEKFADSWMGLLALMKRPWFERRWVIQEISLARRAMVYCGNDAVSWEDFAAATSICSEVNTSMRMLFKYTGGGGKFGHADKFFSEAPALTATRLVNMTNRIFRRSSNGIVHRLSALEDIVTQFAMFESSEPRDTIYALLALAKDSQPFVGRIPDYFDGKMLTKQQKKAMKIIAHLLPNPYRQNYEVNYRQQVVDVYQQFVAFAILKSDPSRALDIICKPWAARYTEIQDADFDPELIAKISHPDRVVKLPTWIRDKGEAPFQRHRVSQRRDRLLGMDQVFAVERQSGDLFVSASGYPEYHATGVRVLGRGKALFRKGKDFYSMFVDGFTLDTVCRVEPASQLGNIPAEWLSVAQEYRRRDPDAFWRTLIADRSPKGPVPPYFKPAIEDLLENAPVESAFNVWKHIHEATSEIASEVLRHVQATIWERRLIVTQRGLLGLAPRTTQVGDVVCILHGCSVPVVLRKTEKTEEQRTMERLYDLKDHLERREIFRSILVKAISRKRKKDETAKLHASGDDSRTPTTPVVAADQSAASQRTGTASTKINIYSALTLLVLVAVAYVWNSIRKYPYLWLSATATMLLSQWIFGWPVSLKNLSLEVVGRLKSLVAAEPGPEKTERDSEHLVESPSPSKSTPILTNNKHPRSSHSSPFQPCYYEVIGESYIHNMMHGEAVEWQNEAAINEPGARRQTFELR